MHRQYSALVIAAVFCFVIFNQGLAQSIEPSIRINIDQVVDAGFPSVNLSLSVLDVQGFPIPNLARENFVLVEDGKQIDDFQVTPVTNSDAPISIVLAIDTSQSMANGTPTPLANAVNTASAFVDALSPQDLVAIVSFSDSVSVVQELTTDRALVKNALATLKPAGATTLNDSIIQSIDLLKNRSERRALILLTDGKDTDSLYSFEQVINEASRWSIPIYPIGFGNVNENQLEQLAELTGGTAQIKPNSSDLTAAFAKITKIFRETYTLDYQSDLKADGKEHQITLRVNLDNWHVEQTRQLIARPATVEITFADLVDGQTVGGMVNFSPTIVTPAKSLSSLDILIDGQALTSISTPPFNYSWDSTKVAPDSHTFTFIATDSASNQGRLDLMLNVRTPIQISINKPAVDEVVGKEIEINVEIDSLAKVGKVEFYIGDVLIGSLQDPPYQLTWDSTSVSPGNYTLRVSAEDVAGFKAEAETPFVINYHQGSGILWIAVIVILATLGIVVPLGIRKRKKLQRQASEYLESNAQEASSIEKPAILRDLTITGEGEVIYELKPSRTSLGRKREENDIPLQGIKASRYHAVIQWTGDDWEISALKSDNPVIINNITALKQVLRHNDVIQLGDNIFRFELRDAA